MSAQRRVIEIHVALPLWAWGAGQVPLPRSWDQGAAAAPAPLLYLNGESGRDRN